MDRDRALQLIESVPVGVLTTIRADGSPRPVPVVFAVTPDGRIVTAVDHKPKSTRRLARLDDIERDRRVAMLWQHYEDDWDALWWVRIDGHARVLAHANADITGPLATRYRHYRNRPPEGPWIEITPGRVVGWP